MKANMKKNSMKFFSIFREEWLMSAAKEPKTSEATTKNDNGKYDPSPSIGEVRLLAGFPEPLAVAVIEDLGDKWLVVPVSDFSVPATDKEVLIGPRVFQMWNAFIVPKSFVDAGWQVECLDADALEDLLEMRKCVVTGHKPPADLAECVGAKVVFANDFRCAYLRQMAMTQLRFKRLVPLAWVIPWKTRGRVTGLVAASLLVGMMAFSVLMPNYMMKPDSARRMVAYEVSYANPAACCECLYEEECAEEECVEEECVDAEYEEIEVRPMLQSPVAIGGAQVKMKSMVASRAPMCKVERMVASRAPESEVVGYERYAEFKENGFRDPKAEPLSTFGLDVDTASYTTMRRYIAEMKRLPPKDAVRIEEFINYFDYGYAEPTDNTPVAVNCELGECPWNTGRRLLRVGVQARYVDEANVPPCNLVFLLDCSGSMSANNGFNTAIKSMKMLASKLRPEDYVSIVTYASGTEVKLGATSGAERHKIEAVLDSLRADGWTAGGEGLQLAYEEAKKNYRKDANNRVVLITDGDFNVGINNPQELERFIAEKRDTGIFLTVMGVGYGNYQDSMMKKLANAGNGNYGFLDNLMEAKKVFMREFGGTMMTVAKDVKLQLEFNPAQVSAYRLLGYESRRLAARDFNDDKKDAGEMGAGHSMTALYEIIPAGSGESVSSVDDLKYQKNAPVASEELLTVKLRYKEPNADTSTKLEFPVKAEVAAEVSESLRFASAVAEAAMLLRDSEFKGNASWSSLIERAKGAKGADTNGYRAEFIRLMETAELMFGH